MCQANIWAPAHLVQQQAHAVACYGALREGRGRRVVAALQLAYRATWMFPALVVDPMARSPNPTAAHGTRTPFQCTARSRHDSHKGKGGEAEGSSMVDGLGAARAALESVVKTSRTGLPCRGSLDGRPAGRQPPKWLHTGCD